MDLNMKFAKLLFLLMVVELGSPKRMLDKKASKETKRNRGLELKDNTVPTCIPELLVSYGFSYK